MSNENRKHRRNMMATRIIGPILCIEQLVYGLLFAVSGSTLQKIYFASSLAIGVLCVLSFLVPAIVKQKDGVLYDVMDMVPLAFGLSIAYVRMLLSSETLLNIPTIYLAVLFGGAVVFLLDYMQSIILYGGITLVSMISAGSGLPIHPSVPFQADFLVNGAIGWALSAVTYYNYKRNEEQRMVIEEKNRQLTYISEHDWLTGLYNRRKLEQCLSEIMQERSTTQYFYVVLFDLDFFKNVNDTWGHQEGDRLLKILAEMVQQKIGRSGIAGRWGGEEFLVLCDQEGPAFAEALRSSIASTKFGTVEHLTASFGIARIDDYYTSENLIRAVDRALYGAKQQGRNRVNFDEDSVMADS